MRTLLLKFKILFLLSLISYESNAQKPNILWIYAEDTSPWMGCYGDEINSLSTPNIDRMASEGVLFNRAFVPSPVCSVTRSSIIVGQSAVRFGAHQHRSSRTKQTRIKLPKDYKLLPEILSNHGYKTFNYGKADYNFVWNKSSVYTFDLKDKKDLSELINNQPFFGQIQLRGGKNNTDKLSDSLKVDPKIVRVPNDYPDNEIFQSVVAQHYEAIRIDDKIIGEILKQLEETGLSKNTIVVYFSDHGANNLLRHKQMLTEGGLRVPFIIMGPDDYFLKKSVRNDIINMLDLSATTLAWAGIEIPYWYEGKNLFGDSFVARKYVAAHRDRLDHTIDMVRSIRTNNYRYVRNYLLDRILLQPQYRDNKMYTKNMHHLYKNGKLSEIHQEIYFGERKREEFYNVEKDPEMIHNLAENPKFNEELEMHRTLLFDWLSKGDMGFTSESVESLKANGEDNSWGYGINPEYEKYRKDSDGDGLSDGWEINNKRNPDDGILFYEFDCGGWQTEGWSSEDTLSNLSGNLGYLDFNLDKENVVINRHGLNIKGSSSKQAFTISLKSESNLKISIFSNNGELGRLNYISDNLFKKLIIPIEQKVWNLGCESVSILFEGEKNSLIEIDYIKQIEL